MTITVDGPRIVFGGASALISDALEHARSGLGPDHAAVLERTKATPHAWAALLNGDAELVAALADSSPATGAGKLILAAMRRAAEPGCSPAALRDAALAAAEAAAAHVKGKRCTDARLRSDLSRPVAAELVAWTATGVADASQIEAPEHPAARRARLEAACTLKGKKREAWIADRMAAPSTAPRAAVRLTGGPFGRGVVVAPVGTSRLEWTKVVWLQALAAYTASRPSSPRPSSSVKAEVPMVVLVDGVAIGASLAGTGEWAAALAERGGEPMSDEQVEAFMIRAAQAARLPGEETWLREVADGDMVEGVAPEWLDRARGLAQHLSDARADDPRLVAIRSDVVDRNKDLRRLASNLDRRSAWAQALAHHARRTAEDLADQEEAAALAAWLDAPPPACARFLAPGAEVDARDPWLAHVARSAIGAELDALDERLTRPAPRRSFIDLRTQLLPPWGGRGDAQAAVVSENARQGGVTMVECKTYKDALEATRRAQEDLGPGECAVCVEAARWCVARGTLPALLAGGLCGVEMVKDAPFGQWAPPAGLDDLFPEATAWAVARWVAAGCDGDPPPVADAVAAVRADALR